MIVCRKTFHVFFNSFLSLFVFQSSSAMSHTNLANNTIHDDPQPKRTPKQNKIRHEYDLGAIFCSAARENAKSNASKHRRSKQSMCWSRRAVP